MDIPEKQRKKIGEALKKLRKDAGFGSYENFANDHGLSRITVYRMESGTTNFRINTLIKVLSVHDLTLEQFFKSL